MRIASVGPLKNRGNARCGTHERWEPVSVCVARVLSIRVVKSVALMHRPESDEREIYGIQFHCIVPSRGSRPGNETNKRS